MPSVGRSGKAKVLVATKQAARMALNFIFGRLFRFDDFDDELARMSGLVLVV